MMFFLAKREGPCIAVIMQDQGETWLETWQHEKSGKHAIARFFNKKNGRIIPKWADAFEAVSFNREAVANGLRKYELRSDGSIIRHDGWYKPYYR